MRKTSRKDEYILRVTRGEGFMPWQAPGQSRAETQFRAAIERRKDAMLANRVPCRRPVFVSTADVARARRNLTTAGGARTWFAQRQRLADFILRQNPGYVSAMIDPVTPANYYAVICPHCAGKQSQPCGPPAGGTFDWDYRQPAILTCTICGHVYPDAAYPETATLQCPRSGQTFTYYLNPAEQKYPADRSGRHAWHWFGHAVHTSFSGLLRYYRARFLMLDGLRSLAVVYRLTGEPRYARVAVQILDRLAACYRQWLYHDYWDTIADADPLYAAWHGGNLPLEWKKNLAAEAYRTDSADRAAMLQSYWGAGRFHSSIDLSDGQLLNLCHSYDLVRDARDEAGRPLWDRATRDRVERDLFLEAMLTAEPFLGGRGRTANLSNLAVNSYDSMAAVARCLGIAEWADTALRAYLRIRDARMHFDGFCRESPLYNNRYLYGLALLAESLDGFRWPRGFRRRSGVVRLYRTDPFLRLLFRAALDQLQPNGCLLPLSDTFVSSGLWESLPEIGLRRFPEYYAGFLPLLLGPGRQSTQTPCARRRRKAEKDLNNAPMRLPDFQYALFHLEADQAMRQDASPLPEILFPGWQTALLRHGSGYRSSVLALPFNAPGGHRHRDNLSLYYADRGQAILGDLGYVETVNEWLTSSFSHNLVIVDNQEQLDWDRRQDRGPAGRAASLRLMATTPRISVVEAESRVYPQCRDYRRLVALVKGPGAETFTIDIFRVRGGNEHTYRIFSELASSDAGTGGSLEFTSLGMPAEKPLPTVGSGMRSEDIFGLRDSRTVTNPPSGWRVTWKQNERAYRLWMLAQVHSVRAANGPGQESWAKPGRRIRYLDAINRGHALASTFVAIHEPSGPHQTFPIFAAERLTVPAEAGPDAVALCIRSRWGTYLVLSDFTAETALAGVRFQGQFAILGQTRGERWLLACGARTCRQDALGFENLPAAWSGTITHHTQQAFTTNTVRSAGWPKPKRIAGVTSYVLMGAERRYTGFPVRSTTPRQITVERFPLQPAERFLYPSVRFHIASRRKFACERQPTNTGA